MSESDENEVQLRDFREGEDSATSGEPGDETAAAASAADGKAASPGAPEKQPAKPAEPHRGDDMGSHTAADVEVLFDVPVKVSAVLGRAQMEVNDLLKVGKGTVIELDRKVGEAIDIYVNNRLVARGEVVLVDDRLGVTMTEIIKAERN